MSTAWIAAMAALAFVVGVGSWLFWRTPRPENRPLVRLNVDLGSGVVSGFVWDRLGDAHFQLGEVGPAYPYLVRARDLDPDNADVHLQLGTVYLLSRRRAQALGEEARGRLAPFGGAARRLGELVSFVLTRDR